MERLDITESLLARFWAKVDKTETCWLWTGYCAPSLSKRFAGEIGYGTLSVGGRAGRPRLAHVVSWVIHFGEVPEGLNVLHTCDVRNCVNPSHLWLGTLRDNTLDAIAKGRKWTDEEREAQRTRTRLRSIGNKYGEGVQHTDRKGINASAALRRGKPMSAEHREAISRGLLASTLNKGKHLSPERRAAVSRGLLASTLNKGKHRSPEQREAIRRGVQASATLRKGKPLTSQHRAAISRGLRRYHERDHGSS